MTFCVKVSLITIHSLHESGDQDLVAFLGFFFHLHFLHVKAQGMVPFTCSPFVSSAPCRLFLSDFDVTSSSLCTCYYLSKADSWISFSRINKVLLCCIVLFCLPRQIFKNVLVVSFGFLFLFTAFQSMANLQTSLNKEDGVGAYSLSAVYAALIVSCIFLPKWVSFPPKWVLPVQVSICLATYLPAQVSIFLSKWMTSAQMSMFSPSECLPVRVSICLPTYLPVQVSIFLSGWMTSCPGEYFSAQVSVFLFRWVSPSWIKM